MKNRYTYKICIFTKDNQGADHNEISFSFDNPLIARSLAIQELKKIIAVADQQLSGASPINPYGIPEWDDPTLVTETPEMNSILTPLSVELILDLEGTEYILYGAGVQETIEALSAEACQYRLDGLITENLQIGLLENVDRKVGMGERTAAFLFTDCLTDIPDFSFIQHSILKEHAVFLLTDGRE